MKICVSRSAVSVNNRSRQQHAAECLMSGMCKCHPPLTQHLHGQSFKLWKY